MKSHCDYSCTYSLITSYLTTRDILAIDPGVNFSFFTNQMRQLKTRFTEGTIHVLRNQDFGFSDPTALPSVITYSTERNQKLPFSDPPLL